MTTGVLDPGLVIADAVRELVDSVRKVVSEDTEDPSVLDELSRLLGRARRRVNRAKKAPEPESAPTAKQEPRPAPAAAAPAVPVAKVSTSTDRSPAVTVTIPKPMPEPRNEVATRSDPQVIRPIRIVRSAQMSHVPLPAPDVGSVHRHPRRWPWIAVLVILGVIATAAYIVNRKPGGDGADDRPATAEAVCERFVKDRLKSPASAQFSGVNTIHAPSGTADFFTVTGSVDSQNSFGAVLRNQYTCKLTGERDGTWRLTDLTFTGR